MKWIQKVEPGELVNNGLSIRVPGREDHLFELLALYPIFIWYRRHVYDINNDVRRSGWYVLKLFISVGKAWGMAIDIRLALGWVLRG